MRHGSSRRQRNSRSNNNGGRRGGNRNQVYDSNGPDVRIRGTAYQITEKYMALAKDAKSAGDYVMEQNYLQHAEHYQRIINSLADDNASKPSQPKQEEKSGNSKEASQKPKADDLGLPESIVGKPASSNASKEDTVSA